MVSCLKQKLGKLVIHGKVLRQHPFKGLIVFVVENQTILWG